MLLRGAALELWPSAAPGGVISATEPAGGRPCWHHEPTPGLSLTQGGEGCRGWDVVLDGVVLAGRVVWSVVPGFRVDALGPGGAEVIEAPRLTVGLGRREVAGGSVPESDVLRLLRAPHGFDEVAGFWAPVVDADGWTGMPGLYAAAGPACRAPDWDLVLGGMRSGDVVCACEGVTRGSVEVAAAAVARDMNQMKAFTRCGMGVCQGRACEEVAAEVLGRCAGGRAAVGQWTVRPPLAAVPLDGLIGEFAYGDIPVPAPAPL